MHHGAKELEKAECRSGWRGGMSRQGKEGGLQGQFAGLGILQSSAASAATLGTHACAGRAAHDFVLPLVLGPASALNSKGAAWT